MVQFDDYELAKRCATGEEAAWRELMKRHGQTVFAVCFRVLRDDVEARDAAQESFVKALKGLGHFQEGRALRPWLIKIAWNHSLRKSALRSRLPIPTPMESDELHEAMSTLPDPAEVAEEKELQVELHRLVERLPEQQRVIFELRCGQGMDYREIAEALGIPMGTVKTSLFRARERLIKELAQGESDELQRNTSIAAVGS